LRWRQIFRELSRGTDMKAELVDYMVGHESKSGTGARYGKRQVVVLAQQMALFPRFKVPAINRPPAPHKRVRRTRKQIAADEAVREARHVAKLSARRPTISATRDRQAPLGRRAWLRRRHRPHDFDVDARRPPARQGGLESTAWLFPNAAGLRIMRWPEEPIPTNRGSLSATFFRHLPEI